MKDDININQYSDMFSDARIDAMLSAPPINLDEIGKIDFAKFDRETVGTNVTFMLANVGWLCRRGALDAEELAGLQAAIDAAGSMRPE